MRSRYRSVARLDWTTRHAAVEVTTGSDTLCPIDSQRAMRVKWLRCRDTKIVELGTGAAPVRHDAGLARREGATRRRAVVNGSRVQPSLDVHVAGGARDLESQ